MIGFAMRAGKVIVGTEQVCIGMAKAGRVKLVILSAKASEGTRKKVRVKSEYYGIHFLEVDLDTETLGAMLGKTFAPSAIAITDENFAREIEKCTDSL